MMLNKMLKMKSSVLRVWVISYTLVFLLPLFLSIVVYYQSETQVNAQIQELNGVVLDSIKERIDNHFLFVENLSIDMAIDNDILEIAEYTLPLTGQGVFRLYQFTKNFSKYNRQTKEYVNNFFIYFENIDLIVSTSGFSNTSKNFYNAYFSGGELSYQQWKELISSKSSGEYQHLNFSGKKEKDIIYVRTLPITSKNDSVINVISMIDSNSLLKTVQQLYLKDYGELVIMDNNDNLVTFTGKSNDTKNVDMKAAVNDKRNLTAMRVSEINNWKYIYVLAKEKAFEKIYYIKKIMLIYLLFCIITGILLIVIFTIRNYKSVFNLIQLFPNDSPIDDEYSYLGKKIKESISEKYELKYLIEKQSIIVKNHLLNKLLNGNELTDEREIAEIEQLNIDFAIDYFAILLFCAKNNADIFFEQNNEQDSSDLEYFIIGNIVDELLLNEGYTYNSTKIDGYIAYVINFSEQKKFDADIVEMISYAEMFIKQHFNFDFICTLSDLHQNQFGIQEGYSESKEALETLNVTKKKGVYQYRDLKNNISDNYYFSLEKEQQLINCVRSGEMNKVLKILEEIFEKNKKAGEMSLNTIRCLMMNLCGSAIKGLSGIVNEEEVFGDKDYINQILKSHEMDEMKKIVIDIFQTGCDQMSHKISVNTSLSQKIFKYVQDNYKDQALNVAMISQSFSLHHNYLSRLFKEQTGQRLLDYINHLRVEEAKALLKEKDIPISKVYEDAGFNNYRTFVRVFTQIVGITPKQFKEIELHETK